MKDEYRSGKGFDLLDKDYLFKKDRERIAELDAYDAQMCGGSFWGPTDLAEMCRPPDRKPTKTMYMNYSIRRTLPIWLRALHIKKRKNDKEDDGE